MKKLSLLLFLALVIAAPAQDSTPVPPSDPASPATSPTPAAPGPGIVLPPHSAPLTVKLDQFQENAMFFAQRMGGVAAELFSYFAILSLIWTGYHAQFRGLQDFVGTLLTICITSALLKQYHQLIPYLVDARAGLKEAIGSSDFVLIKQLGAMFVSIGTTAALMSVSGLGMAIGLLLLILAGVVVWAVQLLFEAVLIGIGPLAVATFAFHSTRGIAVLWFKTLIGIMLIPVGWTLGSTLIGGLLSFGASGGPKDLLATIIYVCSYAAVFLGMPAATLLIVNAAGGPPAAALPSLINSAAAALSTGASFGSRGSSGGGSIASFMSKAVGGNAHFPMAAASSAPAASASSRPPDAVSQRVMQAQRWHEQIQPKPARST